jgi:hypothetical protein
MNRRPHRKRSVDGGRKNSGCSAHIRNGMCWRLRQEWHVLAFAALTTKDR